VLSHAQQALAQEPQDAFAGGVGRVARLVDEMAWVSTEWAVAAQAVGVARRRVDLDGEEALAQERRAGAAKRSAGPADRR
jgi:hypothetical protein